MDLSSTTVKNDPASNSLLASTPQRPLHGHHPEVPSAEPREEATGQACLKAMQNVFVASNSCRNCRQKRVKCDRRLPGCLRCSSLKLQCQGYERPKKLVWTNSMATRGKMMGKSTYAAPEVPTQTFAIGDPRLSGDGMSATAVRAYPPVSWSLTEPSLQDLSPECRKYIRYFDLDLSRDSVVYDQPSTNPFLAMVPLISRSQALSHAIVSIAAFHHTHRMVISHTQNLPGGLAALKKFDPWHCLSKHHGWQMCQSMFCDPLRTALLHKQKALECLKKEVRDDPTMNSDAVVAAIILFVCMDVVEFGSHGWNHHLRGAEEMVRSRRKFCSDQDDVPAPWLKYFDTACTTFGILGATLAPSISPYVQKHSVMNPSFLQTLRHSENQTWVGCPAELLYLLSAINSIRSLPPTATGRSEVTLELYQNLAKFSPLAWAEDFPDHQHHESRYHLAHAYKAAVEVYAYRVTGANSGHHYLSSLYLLQILQPAMLHLLAISPEDFHIKSVVWPAFILGAEAHSEELRDMARTVFQRIWVSSCCYNARNAIEILENIWSRSIDHDVGESWLEHIWQLEETWLFV